MHLLHLQLLTFTFLLHTKHFNSVGSIKIYGILSLEVGAFPGSLSLIFSAKTL